MDDVNQRKEKCQRRSNHGQTPVRANLTKKKNRFFHRSGINPDWVIEKQLKETKPLWELQQKSLKMTRNPTVNYFKEMPVARPSYPVGCFWYQHLSLFSWPRKSALGKCVTWSEMNIAKCIPPTPTTHHMHLAHLAITGTLTEAC